MTELTEWTGGLEGWQVMWLLAFGLWLPLKAFGLWRVGGGAFGLAMGWFLARPGTDAGAFFKKAAEPPLVREIAGAVARMLLGCFLVWAVCGRFYPEYPLAAGWVGMVGIILLLHFGMFELLSAVWRAFGVAAEPIMREPVKATSLTEFWGRRWNVGFSIPARRFIFVPLAPRVGAKAAALMVFLVSGLAHEIVITIPAGGGYWLPTGYFALQGMMALFEKTRLARAIGMGRGAAGWAWTMVVVIAPVGFLFPPVFVRNVILPMLKAIGAIGGEA